MTDEQDPWHRHQVADQAGVFRYGLDRWHQQDAVGALECFREADQHAERDDAYGNVYTSYHGVAMVFAGDVSGLNLCRQAAGVEQFHADVFHNLALAEHRMSHRRRAYMALNQGLKLDRRHAGLHRLRLQMGVRRRPVLTFLNRDNPLNRVLGKLTYRMARPTTAGRA